MNDLPSRSIPELLADSKLVAAAISQAVNEAVLDHARAGNPIAVSDDGKVKWISPAEILAGIAGESEME